MDSNELIRRLAKLKGRLLDDVEHLAAMLANLEAEGPMSSAGEEPISTPPIQMSWEEWAGFQARLEELEAKVAALEEFRRTHQWTVWQTSLEGGPPSPATTASPTEDNRLHVQDDPMIQETPRSSPWGQHIMTFRVVHACGSALPTLVDKDNRPLTVYCGTCGALLELEPIPAPAVPASPSENT
jgi:hypothetical protein